MAKRSPRLIFTEEERALPELERAVRKADRAAVKLEKAEAKIPKRCMSLFSCQFPMDSDPKGAAIPH